MCRLRNIALLALLAGALLTTEAQSQIRIRAVTSGACDEANVLSGNASNCPLLTTNQVVGTFLGGFRVPSTTSNGVTMNFGPLAIAFDPADGNLFVASALLAEWSSPATAYEQYVGKISIPALVDTSTLGSMNVASYVSGFADPVEGTRTSECGSACSIKGMTVYDGRLYLTYSYNFDTSDAQAKQMASRPTNLSTTGDVKGIDEFYGGSGTGLSLPHYTHFTNHWIGVVPSEWRTALGGTMFSGGQHTASIISNKSHGFSMGTFNPADIGSGGSQPYTWNALAVYSTQHRTLGRWDTKVSESLWPSTSPDQPDTAYFSMSHAPAGCVVIKHSRTYACFGRYAETAAYGIPTNVPGDHLTPHPTEADLWIYDPEHFGVSHGPHGNPYHFQVQLIDLVQLAEVKAGTRNPWDVTPYAVADFTLPINSGDHVLGGIAYDETNQRIYFTHGQVESIGCCTEQGVIYAFQIGGVS